MGRSTARLILAAPLWCACVATAAGQAEIVQGDAIGFVETLRVSLIVPGPVPTGRIVVTADVRPMLERMWRDSPTFRRQYARLVDASVTVVVRRVGPSAELTGAAAISRIDLQHGLVTVADVRLGNVEPRYLAHEIEHVLEQIDGVDLRSAAAQGVRGVAAVRQEHFETARAISVGAQVARELDLRPQPHGTRSARVIAHRGG